MVGWGFRSPRRLLLLVLDVSVPRHICPHAHGTAPQYLQDVIQPLAEVGLP